MRRIRNPVRSLVSSPARGLAPASEGPVPLREGAPATARDFLPALENQFCAQGAGWGEGIIPSAFEFFNQQMGGWRAGLHLLAGEPGSGKTSFALCNAAAAARQGFPVLFLSFDVQSELLVMKLLCQQSEINRREMLDGVLEPGIMQTAMAAQAETFSRITPDRGRP